MKTRVSSKVKGRGGSEYYPCALCQDEGEVGERAENMVLIRLRTGGEEEWVSVCARHAAGVGKAESQYELVGRPVVGVPEGFVQAKRREELQSGGEEGTGEQLRRPNDWDEEVPEDKTQGRAERIPGLDQAAGGEFATRLNSPRKSHRQLLAIEDTRCAFGNAAGPGNARGTLCRGDHVHDYRQD